MSFPLPVNESQRLQVLHDLQVLDSLPQNIFDNITALAASICGAPTALISLVDDERVWFKARLGYEGTESRRDESLCSHAIMEPDRVFVVNDASLDPRFAAFPLVMSGALRFYAGAAMTTSAGHALGVVCVLDRQSREMTQSQTAQLRHLADLAMSLIENESYRRREAGHVLDLVRKEEQIIRSVLDQGQEMCSFIDLQHRFQFINPTHEHYWSQPRENLLGMHVQDLVGDRLYFEIIKPGINKALAGEETRLAFGFDFPGAGLRHMEVRHIPARDDEGQVFGVIERFRDVTELTDQAHVLRNHVSELSSQRLAQRKYLHVISHDLKEPINAINNAVPLLSARLQDKLEPLESRCLAYIGQGGQRMAQLLEDLRLFSEMDTVDLQVAVHQADALLSKALEQVNQSLARRPVRMEIHATGALRVNAGVFELAVRYLVETLIGRSPRSSPHVTLQLTHSDQQTRLQLVDHAEASDSEPSPSDRHAQTWSTTTLQPEPTLTLSLAEHIVKAHRGTLGEDVTAQGSRRYTVTLPKAPTE